MYRFLLDVIIWNRQDYSYIRQPYLPEVWGTQHSPMNEPVSGDGEQLATFHIIEASRALAVFHGSKHSTGSPCKMNAVGSHTCFSGDVRH